MLGVEGFELPCFQMSVQCGLSEIWSVRYPWHNATAILTTLIQKYLGMFGVLLYVMEIVQACIRCMGDAAGLEAVLTQQP